MTLLKNFFFPVAIISAFYSVALAEIPRSAKAKAEFKRIHPCPSNGMKHGPCPGYQIDHVIPLKCHGVDHHENMQWLTVEEHKEKTRREAALCRRF